MNTMNKHEKSQSKAIEDWKKKEPGLVRIAGNVLFKPVGWLVNIIIPKKVTRGLITAANATGKHAANKSDILNESGVSSIADLQDGDLEVCDKLAESVKNWARAIAAAEGAVIGWAGIPGMLVDIPFIISFAFRTAHKIGLCYGFEMKSEEDNIFIVSIIGAAGANTIEEKTAALLALREIQVMIAKTTWKRMAEKAAENQMSKETAVLATKEFAKKLGINITKRKVGQFVPIVGAGVAAAVNLAFINEIAVAAIRIFQEQWLVANNKIVGSDENEKRA